MKSSEILLLIDDEDNDAILVKRALSKAGRNIGFRRACDGEEGIAYLKGEGNFRNREEHPVPSVIVLDLKMPRKNGFEVLKWIRTHEQTKLMPVIIFTSSKEKTDVTKAYGLGANAFMVKPNSFDQLIEVMGMICNYWMDHCIRAEAPGPPRKI